MGSEAYRKRYLSGDLTPEQRRDLVRVIEECSEVIHCATKILRFGPHCFHPADADQILNVTRFRQELKDLRAAVSDLGEKFDA